MKEYASENIRNIALCGHMSSGKTSLAEALLFRCKHTDRLGKVDDGTTVSDSDPEEINRKQSITASVLPLETKNVKINLFDCPGNRDFVGEIRDCVRVAEAVGLVVDASAGVEVGTEMAFDIAREFGAGAFAVVTKMDKERANFQAVVDQLSSTLDVTAVPVTLPIGEAESFAGVVDLLKMKAVTEDESGKSSLGPIPDDMQAAADEARAALVEAAAEGDDELTMKFLEDEPLSEEEVHRGLKGAVADGRFVPVLCAAGLKCVGVTSLLDFAEECVVAPTERAFPLGGEEDKAVACEDSPLALAFVFKTIVDDFAGRLSFFRILRGTFKSDSEIQNLTKDKSERISHLLTVRGRKQENVHQLSWGDIGCLAKSASIETGDTIGAPKATERVAPTPMPKPTCFKAVSAKSKADEDKLSMSLHRLTEQDTTIHVRREAETHETVLEGMGETHVDVAVARLKAAAKIDVEIKIPKVAYRETIRKTCTGSYRHKKQSGGRGQFGEVHMRFEPRERGEGFEFVWEVVGGNIPTNYQSAVEKGIVQAMERGIVAGNPAVDIRAACFDGKYHDVDSSDMAFILASSQAFKNIAPTGDPVILEPIVSVKVTAPESNMGDIMGVFSSKRGRVLGSSSDKGKVVIESLAPLAEMYTFSRELRSMTGGRGVFEMDFSHYEAVPREVQQQLIQEYEQSREE